MGCDSQFDSLYDDDQGNWRRWRGYQTTPAQDRNYNEGGSLSADEWGVIDAYRAKKAKEAERESRVRKIRRLEEQLTSVQDELNKLRSQGD